MKSCRSLEDLCVCGSSPWSTVGVGLGGNRSRVFCFFFVLCPGSPVGAFTLRGDGLRVFLCEFAPCYDVCFACSFFLSLLWTGGA